jgi:uncharacterized membrane protein YccC
MPPLSLPALPVSLRPHLRELGPILFGLRTALAALAALWIAMWLQFDTPRWAAWTVMALALPTRGMIAMKGVYRIAGTLIGLAAGLVGVALFAQSALGMGLFLTAWMAAAALTAGRLRGLGPYGTALAGLTACLIAVESEANPNGAFLLALDRSSTIVVGVVCAYLASAIAESLQGTPDTPGPPVLPLPPPATVRANALRVAVAFFGSWLLWMATAWPSGPIFVILVGALALNFVTVPNVARGASAALWGVTLGQALGVLLKYTVLTTTPSFAILAAVLFPCLFIGGLGMTDPRTILPTLGFNISFLLAVEPRNPMQYDLGASLNETLGIIAGVAAVVAAFRYIRPDLVWRFP